MALPLPWVRHLQDPEHRDKFEQSVRASVTALSRLYDLLEEREKALHDKECLDEDYILTSNWPYQQAFRNGRKAQIKELKELLGFIKGNKG